MSDSVNLQRGVPRFPDILADQRRRRALQSFRHHDYRTFSHGYSLKRLADALYRRPMTSSSASSSRIRSLDPSRSATCSSSPASTTSARKFATLLHLVHQLLLVGRFCRTSCRAHHRMSTSPERPTRRLTAPFSSRSQRSGSPRPFLPSAALSLLGLVSARCIVERRDLPDHDFIAQPSPSRSLLASLESRHRLNST